MPANNLLRKAAELYEKRNKVYGDNYLLVGEVMKGFFPNGLMLNTIEDFNRFHIFMLTVVKQTRYVIGWGKGGHPDSIADATVYCAMLDQIDQDIKAKEQK